MNGTVDDIHARNPGPTRPVPRDAFGHLAFGHGVHFRIGSMLAIPRDALRWRESMLLRGLEELPLALAA